MSFARYCPGIPASEFAELVFLLDFLTDSSGKELAIGPSGD